MGTLRPPTVSHILSRCHVTHVLWFSLSLFMQLSQCIKHGIHNLHHAGLDLQQHELHIQNRFLPEYALSPARNGWVPELHKILLQTISVLIWTAFLQRHFSLLLSLQQQKLVVCHSNNRSVRIISDTSDNDKIKTTVQKHAKKPRITPHVHHLSFQEPCSIAVILLTLVFWKDS